MNIFLRELKANRKALILWSVCLFLLVVSGMAKYQGYTSSSAGGAASIYEILKAMPMSVKALLGFGSYDVGTMAGYFAMLFIYIELAVTIHATLLGTGIIAKEERDKTTEYLMVKPVSRTTILTSKLTAALINIVIINIVSLLSSVVMVSFYNKGKDITGEILTMMLSMFLVQLVFLSFGALLAAVMKNPKASGSLAAGVLVMLYFLARITDLSDKLTFLNLLSPFKYYDLAKIIDGKGLNPIMVLLTLVLTAVFIAFAYLGYQKRDLKV